MRAQPSIHLPRPRHAKPTIIHEKCFALADACVARAKSYRTLHCVCDESLVVATSSGLKCVATLLETSKTPLLLDVARAVDDDVIVLKPNATTPCLEQRRLTCEPCTHRPGHCAPRDSARAATLGGTEGYVADVERSRAHGRTRCLSSHPRAPGTWVAEQVDCAGRRQVRVL